MRQKCLVTGCESNDFKKEIYVFSFPKNKERFDKWVEATKNQLRIDVTYGKRSQFVCILHFDDKCFKQKTQFEKVVGRKMKLCSVPPIFPSDSNYKYHRYVCNADVTKELIHHNYFKHIPVINPAKKFCVDNTIIHNAISTIRFEVEGIAILFCFVIKAEYNLRSKTESTTSSLKKTSTKTSLEENYCSGSINSPLNFYASHEKEKENESGPLQLTIISTSHCQPTPSTTTKSSVETFLGVVSTNSNSNTILQTGSGIVGNNYIVGSNNSDKKLNGCDISLHEMEKSSGTLERTKKSDTGSGSGVKSRCCNILGSSSSECSSYDVAVPSGGSIIGFYDAYHRSGSNIPSQVKCSLPENHEFVGVETLDILQGVSPDSIIGIRVSASLSSSSTITGPSTILSANSMKTQTPKSQKRVTIIEEPTKFITSGHMQQQQQQQQSKSIGSTLPPIIKITSTSSIDSEIDSNSTVSSNAAALALGHHLTTGSSSIIQNSDINFSVSSSHGIINNNNSNSNNDNNLINDNSSNKIDSNDSNKNGSDDKIDGMLDRISHDLDYLLNRTSEIPARHLDSDNDSDNGVPPLPSASSQIRKNSSIHHDVIIEESEQELN